MNIYLEGRQGWRGSRVTPRCTGHLGSRPRAGDRPQRCCRQRNGAVRVMRIFAPKKNSTVEQRYPKLNSRSLVSASRTLNSRPSELSSEASQPGGTCHNDERTYGKSFIADFSNVGIGTVDNQTQHTFGALASQGKKGEKRGVTLAPGRWGGDRPIPYPSSGEKLDDIDFIVPIPGKPINCAVSGLFKIGSNDATILPSPYDPTKSRSVIDDWDSYIP